MIHPDFSQAVLIGILFVLLAYTRTNDYHVVAFNAISYCDTIFSHLSSFHMSSRVNQENICMCARFKRMRL